MTCLQGARAALRPGAPFESARRQHLRRKCLPMRCASTSVSVSEVKWCPPSARAAPAALVIFDHAVVDERDFAALVEMRMRIFVGHFAVGGPARVADAVRAGGRFLGHQFGKVRDASGAFARLDLLPVNDRDAGGIVAAIFEPTQTVEKDGSRF